MNTPGILEQARPRFVIRHGSVLISRDYWVNSCFLNMFMVLLASEMCKTEVDT